MTILSRVIDGHPETPPAHHPTGPYPTGTTSCCSSLATYHSSLIAHHASLGTHQPSTTPHQPSTINHQPPFTKLFALCLWFFLLCFSGSLGFAASESTLKTGLSQKTFVSSTQEAWTVEAGKIVYDYEKKVYEAEENVRVASIERSIQADWALLDTQQQQVELKGNVLMRFGKSWLQGDHVLWNLASETGWVDGGMVYFAENHFYVQGKSIAKTGPNTYDLKDGFLTSCDPANADWKIKYERMNVEMGGYAWVKNSSFWARSVPLFYAPVLGLPVKQERQSGLLMPWAGTSTLNGVEGEVPFYWAIRKDMDATLYGRMMQKRGWMTGLEYRLNNDKFGEGTFQFNYLYDQSNAAFDAQQGYPLETRNRFWGRSRYNLNLPNQITAKLDVDVVSDPNYLKEFLGGSTSYTYSNNVFRQQFGRGILEDNTVSFRESTLYLERPSESTVLSLDTRYWDQSDPTLRNLTLQRLPSLGFNAVPTWLGGLPLYYTMESSWTEYWRNEGTQGNRMDLFPRLAYPLHWQSFLNVEPSTGVRSTNYVVDWQDNSRNSLQSRLLADARLELSSRVNRVYPLNVGNYTAVEHAIRPELFYEYVPEVSQTNLPSFSQLDKDQARHDVLFGFSTFFTTKAVTKDAENNPVTNYREVVRFEALQQFNIEKPPLDTLLNPEPKTGLSDLNLRLDLMPKSFLTLTYDSVLLPDEGRSKQQDLYMNLDSGHGQLLRIGYQYRNDFAINEVIAELGLKVLSNVYLNTYHDYSFDKQELFNQGYGIRYIHGCWGISFVYQKEAGNTRFLVSVNLLGIGSIGSAHGLGALGSGNPMSPGW
jgi:LPS-assembly protein